VEKRSAFSYQQTAYCLPSLSFNFNLSFQQTLPVHFTTYYLLLTNYSPSSFLTNFRPLRISCLLLAVGCQLPSGVENIGVEPMTFPM
jgi:hypothetical protein